MLPCSSLVVCICLTVFFVITTFYPSIHIYIPRSGSGFISSLGISVVGLLLLGYECFSSPLTISNPRDHQQYQASPRIALTRRLVTVARASYPTPTQTHHLHPHSITYSRYQMSSPLINTTTNCRLGPLLPAQLPLQTGKGTKIKK